MKKNEEKKEGITLMQVFLTELRNRWKLVLLIAILAAAALTGEKMLAKEPVAKSTTLYVEQQVFIRQAGAQPAAVHYGEMFNSYGTLIAFIHQSEQVFDYTKFQPGWNGMDDEEKSKWLQKHILTRDVSPGIFLAATYVGPNEWKDADYARENGRKILESYIRFNEKQLQRFDPSVTFELQEPVELLPQEVAVARKPLLGKYAIVGFVLGALVGIFIVFVLAVRKRHA